MNNTPQYLYDASKFDDRFAGNMWDQLNAISHSIPVIIQEPAKTVWDQMIPYVRWFETETGVVVAGAIVASLTVSFLVLQYLRAKKPMGNGDMRHWQRQQELQKILSDLLCDVVEEARYKDMITKAEKQQLYQKMGKFFEMPDLMITRHPSRKKAEIRQRIGNGVYRTKPKIPGEAPVVSVPTVKPPVRNRMALKKSMRTTPVEA